MDWLDRTALSFLEGRVAVGTRRAKQMLLKLRILFGVVLLFSRTTMRGQGRLPVQNPTPSRGETTQEFNQRLEESRKTLSRALPEPTEVESRIGADDMLEITVFEAPELNHTLRVSANGEISLQLLGEVKAGGLTPRQLELVLQELLRRTYMNDPHVGVFVRELQSHPVSVVGAVKRPGVFQIRGTRTVLELLSMAEGLADDAGDTVLVMRGASFPGASGRENTDQKPHFDAAVSLPIRDAPLASRPTAVPQQDAASQIEEVNLKRLLESDDPAFNIPVHPGDIVKVPRAGIVRRRSSQETGRFCPAEQREYFGPAGPGPRGRPDSNPLKKPGAHHPHGSKK